MQVFINPDVGKWIDFTSRPWAVKEDAPEDMKQKAKEWLDGLDAVEAETEK